jgi:hypothetical protein
MMRQRRELDLEGRLNYQDTNKNSIKFDRLPRKKMRPIWWRIGMIFAVLYLLYFLKNL